MRPDLAEFIGTFVLVFCGCGSAVLAADHIGHVGVSSSFGFVLLAMIYAVGPISGCQHNRAFTLGLTRSRTFDAGRPLAYIVAQVLGAVAASDILYLIAKGGPGFDAVATGLASNGYDLRSPGHDNPAAFIAEFVLTTPLVLTIVGSTDLEAPVGFAGVAIGIVLVVIHRASIPATDTSVNRARSIGPTPFAGWAAIEPLRLLVVARLLGAAAGLYAATRALDPVLRMPERQGLRALAGETEQRMDRAGIKPTVF